MKQTTAPILIVDDEANMRRILQAMLEREGYHVLQATNGEEALETLREYAVSTVISDLRMPKMDGMTLLHEIKENFPNIPVIVITAFGTVEAAVEALKLGATDFITKPFDRDQLSQIVGKARRLFLADEKEGITTKTFAKKWEIVGESVKLEKVYNLVMKTADSPSTVLITGESGTGKELIAKAIHENSSRVKKPFIKVNCAAIPETLIESELFGHEKGAFTGAVTAKPGRFELADGGTLFLDEIGEISKEIQVKLLRVLQEKVIERVGGIRPVTVDFRLITATNKDLAEEVKSGNFRNDLYYRLNVVPVHLPPLRDRREDIPLLVEHFISNYRDKLNRPVSGVSEPALQSLQSYDWPGNIRELENVIERAVLLTDNTELQVQDFQMLGDEESLLDVRTEAQVLSLEEEKQPSSLVGRALKEVVKETTEKVEKEMIREVLEEHNGNVTHAAKALQISRKSLQQKMKEYGLRE